MSKSLNDEMCRECKFWLPLQGTRDVNSQSGSSVGACRRFPPTGKACQYEGYPSRVSLVMLPESWCGEFRPLPLGDGEQITEVASMAEVQADLQKRLKQQPTRAEQDAFPKIVDTTPRARQ